MSPQGLTIGQTAGLHSTAPGTFTTIVCWFTSELAQVHESVWEASMTAAVHP